jgi:hypothetical protein
MPVRHDDLTAGDAGDDLASRAEPDPPGSRPMFSVCRSVRTVLLPAAALLSLSVAAPAARAADISTVTTPNPGTSNIIGGLTAFANDEVWAVGESSSPSYSGCHGRTLTARFTGSALAEILETPAATPICATVNSVSGSSSSDIWAVGFAGSQRDPHLRHYNGSTWTASAGATLPLPSSGGRSLHTTGLNAVTDLGPTNVWAVGRAMFADSSRHTLIEHLTAGGWSLATGPTTTGSVLNGISAVGAADIWSVGTQTSATGTATLATHYEGSAWRTAATPNNNVNNELTSVAAVASNDVWAVGDSIKNAFDGVSTSRTLVEHFNGSAWSIVPSPNVGAGNNVLTGVAAHAANDVWAVGYDDDHSGSVPVRKTVWMHWDGRRWSVVASPNTGNSDNTLLGVIAPAGTSDLWAWGSSPDGALVQRFTR